MEAFEAGKPEESCPYKGRTGFNGQRRAAWLEGYRLAFNLAVDKRLFERAQKIAENSSCV